VVQLGDMRSSSPARYPSDLTDEQWVLIEPMVAVKPGGRPAKHPRRRIVDAILYVNRTGCSWRQMPHDFPPWDTVYWYFDRWAEDGTVDRLHNALRDAVRDADGRDPLASAGIVDSQLVKGADTLGLLIVVLVTSAALQDRDGGRLVVERAKMKMPSLVLIWADGGYAGKLLDFAQRHFKIVVEIIKRSDKWPTFEVLPSRWVIERTNSWLMGTRRLARDYGRLPEHSEAMVKWTMIGLMTRRLAPTSGRRAWQPKLTE